MEKRGMGHVEMIIAFVLFIGFLLFGLYFFNPLSSNRVLDSSLFYAFDEILTNTSSPLLTYGVSLNASFPGEIQNISFPLSRGAIPGRGCIVTSSKGQVLRSAYTLGVLSISRNNSEFFYVRFGDFLSDSAEIPRAEPVIAGRNYSLSSSDTATVLNEDRLRALNESYYRSYQGLQEAFNLPRRIDFSVTVTVNSTYTISMTRPIPEGFDVLARNERKEIVLTDGRLAFADFAIQVW